jgi:3'(2'), 5'-bisphosphate nucleotidase
VVSEGDADAGGLGRAGTTLLVVDRSTAPRVRQSHDEFAVNIGLVENGRRGLGVVHGRRRNHYAANGPGIRDRRYTGGGAEPIARGCRCRRHRSSCTAEVTKTQPPARRIFREGESVPVVERRKCGSALKFGVLAAGEADCYPRFGTTMEWDTAAGQAILEAAGGSMVTAAGAPLVYGKPGLKNDGFIAWGRKPAW